MASAMDGVVSPATAIEIGRLGGVGVLNLEGLWTRYEDPEPLPRGDRRARRRQGDAAHAGDLRRADQARADRRSASARSRTPASSRARRSRRSAPTRSPRTCVAAELDLLVIQGTVVSAEHVSKTVEPLNLKRFIRELDIPVIVGGCASYQAALHLMRTGAAGVLVGVGPGHACTTRGVLGIGVPQATAIADARAARMRHLDETGVYVHVIADGGMGTGGDIAKAIVCGADAVMIGSPLAAAAEAPGRGYHWGMATFHPTLPRGARVQVGVAGHARARSSSARPTRTTAGSTCSAPCAPRWPPAATRRSRSSRRPRSWWPRPCRPRARASSSPRASGWVTESRPALARDDEPTSTPSSSSTSARSTPS